MKCTHTRCDREAVYLDKMNIEIGWCKECMAHNISDTTKGCEYCSKKSSEK